MAKPETTFYTAVHRLLPKGLYREKMHNPYRGGTPDVWYSGNLDDLWVEYKYITKPPKYADIIIIKELSPLQLLWLNERYKEGRNVCAVLGTPAGCWIYESSTWNHTVLNLRGLIKMGLKIADIADFIRRKTMIE